MIAIANTVRRSSNTVNSAIASSGPTNAPIVSSVWRNP
jgi:hypothetical protein